MTTPLRGDVDPRPPSGDFLRRYNARVLDPATAFRRNNESGPSLRSTVYIADELLTPAGVSKAVEMLAAVPSCVTVGVGRPTPPGAASFSALLDV